jgi:hypothetical protein
MRVDHRARKARFSVGALSIALLAGACGGEEPDRRAASSPIPASGSTPLAGTSAAARDTGAGSGAVPTKTSMSGRVVAHIDTLLAVEAGSLRESLRRHQDAVDAMLASFDADMRALHLDHHREWSARLDALRDDLRLMQSMSVDELHAFLPEYRSRIDALVALHDSLRRNPRP